MRWAAPSSLTNERSDEASVYGHGIEHEKQSTSSMGRQNPTGGHGLTGHEHWCQWKCLRFFVAYSMLPGCDVEGQGIMVRAILGAFHLVARRGI